MCDEQIWMRGGLWVYNSRMLDGQRGNPGLKRYWLNRQISILMEVSSMEKVLACFVLVLCLSTAGGPLVAHHGRGATYDMQKRLTLKGVVTRVDWRNPHVVIYMDVRDADGKVVNWGFENAGVSQLAREGYSRNTLRVGQEITAVLNPAASGEPTGIIVKVILADGKEIMSRERGQNPVN